jgi:hypothetical protein
MIYAGAWTQFCGHGTTFVFRQCGVPDSRVNEHDMVIRVRLLGKFELTQDHKIAFLGVTIRPVDSGGRTIWIVDAHRDDGRRFIVHSDEKLSAFVELERQVLT